MTELMGVSTMFGIGALILVYLGVIHPIVMTRPPVKKILDLVACQDGFSIDNRPDNVGFVLQDTINSTSTCMSIDVFSGNVMMKGEFEWMNEYESKRLYKVVCAIHKARHRKYRKDCRIERESRNERSRQAAIKVYENR